MVRANRPAASQFTASPITTTEPIESTTPKASASSALTRPAGIGRPLVRAMTASISRSYHMLIAPEAPAPTATAKMATAPNTGCSAPGART